MLESVHAGVEVMIGMVEGKIILMRESVRRGVVMVKEISIVIGLDTPVITDETDGPVRTLG